MPLNELRLSLSLKITKSEAELQKICVFEIISMNFTFLTQTLLKCHCTSLACLYL
ncbi:hypothetical protein T4D_16058 [Trichinella pseudospiralis]|uniref:Uncharacterized protein n=1 Tax=Trichinella pseudospiralis TaxID=6337 RepID=A0A0V1DQL7_TRIPS|nr:hypothetical protein T4D_16058 [Trichinella pseudospiralis]